MSFYFAHPSTQGTNQSVSPAVADRGLSLLRAKPCDVQVSVLPSVTQPGFASYAKNLPAFMVATLENKRTPIRNQGYPIKKVEDLLPWTLPGLIYSLTKHPNDSKIDQLKQHSTVVEGGRGKELAFVMTNPTLEAIKALVANERPNVKTPHVIGTVNLDAMKMVFVIQKILSAFLLTHRYPAFRHESDVNPVSLDIIGRTIKKRKTDQTTYLASVTEYTDNVEDPSDTDSVGMTDNDARNIELSVAKPTPRSIEPKWGPVASIPNASGLFIPFVKELAVGDTITLPMVLSTYFIRSLGSNVPSMFASLEAIRSAWGVIATTDLGHEITHLAKCIDIAINAQAVVYPIYTGHIYEGCVICGAGYSVSVRSQVYRPIPYAELQTLVSDGSAHARSLREIRALVEDAYKAEIDQCSTLRQLSTVLLGIELDGVSRQKVLDSAYKLSFPNKYWSTAPMNVKNMLHYLGNPDVAIPTDVPMHPKYLFSTDRVELVLSAFGHQAPTFMIPNGRKTELSEKDPPKNFHVRTIMLESAIIDMKYVLENGYVTNNLQNLSAKHRDAPLNGPNKTEVWKMLKAAYQVHNGSGIVVDRNPQGTGMDDTVTDDLW